MSISHIDLYTRLILGAFNGVLCIYICTNGVFPLHFSK